VYRIERLRHELNRQRAFSSLPELAEEATPRAQPQDRRYNQQLAQSALGSKSPLQAMKNWHNLKPELFKK